jgi:uncharacterized protein YjcR
MKLWIESGRSMPLTEVAEHFNVSSSMIRKWKFEDNWDEEPDKRPRGGQPGNKNAVGNKGGPGGDQVKAKNPFLKFFPDDPDYLEILEMVQNMDPLDMIWHGIESSFATLIRMERIMHVENKGEMIKEVKKQKFEIHSTGTKEKPKLVQKLVEEELEFQWSWDRFMTYVKAQSTTLTELRAGIRQFLALAPEHDERLAKLEYMQLRAEKTRVEIEKIKGTGKSDESENWIGALKKAAERRKLKGKET